MSKLRNVDFTTKIILVVLVAVISFILLYVVLSELFVQDYTWGNMMGSMMGNNQDKTLVILVALAVALVAGLLISLLLLNSQKQQPPDTSPPAKLDELEIIKRALSEDEKLVLDEIKKAGEITQDSLRFRLEWSKAKLSRILTNLDKLNLIQRERLGKTYKVFITNDPDQQ